MTEYPDLLAEPKKLTGLFEKDAIERASLLMKHINSVGAYSHSQGIENLRIIANAVLKGSLLFAVELPNILKVCAIINLP